jgi:DNA integrity scanning protein DisA with diadenylate cyclase activity
MKKITFILKYFIYYIIGLISFSIIAFITQRIVIAILLKELIDPVQDLYNILNYMSAYYPYYFIVYTMLYFSILYGVKKYDKHIVNTLNKKLYEIRKDDKE